jgi:hypothetical protein
MCDNNCLNEDFKLEDLKINQYESPKIGNCGNYKIVKNEYNNNFDSTNPTNQIDNGKNTNKNIIFNVTYRKGRKEKHDQSIRKNNKNSEKNIVKKMRTNYHKFLKYHLIILMKKNSIKHKIYAIESKLVININRENTLNLFKMNIKQFFSQRITRKVKSHKKSNNKVLNILIQIDKIKDFLNQNYLDVFYKLFLMNNNEYEKEYGKNSFLFENIQIDDLEREKWLKIINTNTKNNEYGLNNYYINKHGRKQKKINQKYFDKNIDTNININEIETNNNKIGKKYVHEYFFEKVIKMIEEIKFLKNK